MIVKHSILLIFRVILLLSVSMTVSVCKPVQILSGGSISDGLDLSNIRIGEHAGYTRIVFDVTYWEGYGVPRAGRVADNVGHYRFTLSQNHNIEIEFSGFRNSSAKYTNISAQSIVQSIKILRGEAYGDDSSIFYQIRLRHPAKLKVFHLLNPARIVLDIDRL